MRAAALVIAAAMTLMSCGVTPDEDSPTVAYREAESTKSLEVPPDLTRREQDDSVSIPDAAEGVSGQLLPRFEGARFVRVGVNSWLELEKVPPEEVWPSIDRFLSSEGLTVTRREPSLGIVETAWARRYETPPQGGLGGFINNLLGTVGSDDIRDKYMVRLERLEDDGQSGTRVFVNHRATREVSTNPSTRQAGDYAWAQLGGNPAIEAEMTRRLLVYIGASQQRAQAIVDDPVELQGVVPRYVVEGGAARLMIDDPQFRRVFARVGDGLGRMGAEVLSSGIEQGRYVIEWVPPEDVADGGGFLGLFGDDSPQPVELQLQLRPQEASVLIKAADAEGIQRSGPVHRALLRQLAVALGADAARIQRAEEADEQREIEGPSNKPVGTD